ncbi:receptor-type tyrosine-protein phosphatase C-like [Sparus aurata]|uniref:receptor-type tyrosine-protein phosphatase C-like n=1 Tax=Sparus aurata TaxID=8175 RepID=UPI0011C18E56|nr:receptor-type tyrosine-protein phosphatase C-like [Sparus aurata]
MTDSNLPSVANQSVITSPPRIMTTTPVMPSTSSALKPLPTTPTLASKSSIQAFPSTNVSDTSPSLSTTSPSTSNLTQNQTSPAITTPTTTVNDSTKAPSVTPPPLCSYTVTPIKFGLQIDITGSPPGFYTIKMNEGGQHETGKTVNVDFGQTSSHDIKHLKPCTEYEHYVTFDNGTDGQTLCSSSEHKTTTKSMSQSDIKDVTSTSSCVPGSVCYRSEWDISSSMSNSDHIPAQSCTSDNKIFCIKPGFNDICSDLTTTFTSGNCSPFRFTKNIPVGFLIPSEIHPSVQRKLPAEIDTTLPSKCHLTTDYTCQENGQIKELSELEPFTDYSCIGHIMDINNDIIIITTDIPVRINCDLQINNMKTSVTETSIHLSWTTTSTNCQDVLPTLSKLSYDCSCSPAHNKPKFLVNKDPAGGSCDIEGLEPWTDYTCTVQPKYNNNNLEGTSAEVRQKTGPGKPDKVTALSLSTPENNEIKVTCGPPKNLKGSRRTYHARLYPNGYPQEFIKANPKEKCDFVFKDLNYSTTYIVEVTVFNERHESDPVIEHVDTKYNDKAVTGVLVFFIIIIIIIIITAVEVCRIYVLKCRKSRNDVNEDMMLESTAIYVKAPPPGWRRKEAR